jgi:enamine deaminase RidA (YjgF/YER057c/UK114 family)
MRLALLALALCSSAAFAADPPSREHLAPPGMERAYTDYHYSPVVKVGDMVIVSGIPAGPGKTYEERIHRMFENLRKHLETAGATMADVVEITTFHANATDTASFEAEFKKLAPIHHQYFPNNYPAWTAVGTTALLAEGAPVEMRAMAVIGSGKNPKAEIAAPAN